MVEYQGLPGSTPTMPAEPYYLRIMEDIRTRIARGEWPPGHQLPYAEDLAAMYRVQFSVEKLSVGTVRRAVQALILLGELRGQQGKGVYVAEGKA